MVDTTVRNYVKGPLFELTGRLADSGASGKVVIDMDRYPGPECDSQEFEEFHKAILSAVQFNAGRSEIEQLEGELQSPLIGGSGEIFDA